MPFTMSKCAKGAEKRKADDADLASSQAAPKVPKVSEIKVEAPLARPRNPRSRPISAPVQVSFYKYSKNAGLSLSILFTSLSVAQRDLEIPARQPLGGFQGLGSAAVAGELKARAARS